MRIKVCLAGLPAYIAGTDQLVVDSTDDGEETVGKVLHRIEESVSDPLAGSDSIDLKRGYLIYLRRAGETRSVATLCGHDTRLEDGDELILVHRFTGG